MVSLLVPRTHGKMGWRQDTNRVGSLMAKVAINRSGVCGVTVLVAATILATPAAISSTLTNADTKVYELRIEARAGARALSVAPKETIEELCPEGCTMTVVGVDDATYRLEGTERVTIEAGGVVYYDGELPKAKVDGEAAEGSSTAD